MLSQELALPHVSAHNFISPLLGLWEQIQTFTLLVQ